jgi:hypothetical protein
MLINQEELVVAMGRWGDGIISTIDKGIRVLVAERLMARLILGDTFKYTPSLLRISLYESVSAVNGCSNGEAIANIDVDSPVCG